MKTDPDHEKKRTKFNLACENLTCANCGQPLATSSTLCPDCLPINDFAYRFRSWHIPARMMPSIQRYIHEKIKPGQFLTAVICNNLSDAVGRADDENMNNLPAYVSFFYNESPSTCHGSKKKMDAWLARKGEYGKMPKGIHNNHPKMEKHGRWKGGAKTWRGYVLIRRPNHPHVNKSGYIKRATLVLEKKLGRFLLHGEEAHHIDENKQNDNPDNLECKTHAAHAGYHASMRPKARETRTCSVCGINITRQPSQFQVPPNRTTCGVKCRNILNAGERDKNGRLTGRWGSKKKMKEWLEGGK